MRARQRKPRFQQERVGAQGRLQLVDGYREIAVLQRQQSEIRRNDRVARLGAARIAERRGCAFAIATAQQATRQAEARVRRRHPGLQCET